MKNMSSHRMRQALQQGLCASILLAPLRRLETKGKRACSGTPRTRSGLSPTDSRCRGLCPDLATALGVPAGLFQIIGKDCKRWERLIA